MYNWAQRSILIKYVCRDLFPTFITLVLLDVGVVLLVVLPPVGSVPEVGTAKVTDIRLQH